MLNKVESDHFVRRQLTDNMGAEASKGVLHH